MILVRTLICALIFALTACATNSVEEIQQIDMSNTAPMVKSNVRDKQRKVGNFVTQNNDLEMIIVVNNLYAMGDADSRLTAKEAALNEAKVIASEIFGTAVEHEMRLNNGNITLDRLKTYSIAKVNARILDTDFFQKNGTQYLYLSSKLIIDKNELINNLDLIARSGRISLLEKENRLLNRQLQQINLQLKNQASTLSEQTKLINSRNQIFIDIEKNNDSIRRSINKKELIASIANVKAEYESLTTFFDRYVMQNVINNLKIDLGEPYVASYEGEKVRLGIDYKISMNPDSVYNAFSRYYKRLDERTRCKTKGGHYHNINFRGPCFLMDDYKLEGPYAKKLADFLYKQNLYLGIEISGFNQRAYQRVIGSFVTGARFMYEGSGTVHFYVNEKSISRLSDVKAGFYRGRVCSHGGCVERIN